MSSFSVNPSVQVQRLQDELLAAKRRLQAVADLSGALMGKLEFELRQDDQLVLVAADAMADELMGKPCAAFFGQASTVFF